MNKLDLAWAAGFVDGEGSIMLPYSRPSQYRRNGRMKPKTGQVYVHFRVGQSVEAPLSKLVGLFGGRIKEISKWNKRGYTKPFYEWNLYGIEAIEALKQLEPYLLVKYVHCKLAIRFYEECNGIEGNLERRLEYVTQMQALQQKGLHLRKAFDKIGNATT